MTKNRNLKALIVEDDEVQQVIVQNLLNAQGIETKIVDSGLEAWNVIKEKGFNFIMMDVKMPDHDGLEVVQWIRDESDSYFKEIPIFALTSFSSDGYTKQVLKAGMNAHLTKPLEINLLLEQLDKYFPSK